MRTSRNATRATIALAVGAVLLLYVIFGPGLHGFSGFSAGLAAGLLIALGLVLITRQPSTSSAAAAGGATSPVAPRSDAALLNDVNLRARRAGLPPDLVARVERLIDQLGELLPTLSGQFAGFELTWQMQQIAASYLPKLIDAYAGLSEAERPAKRSAFEESLRELEEAAGRTAGALREQKTTEFENISRFLKLRFS